MYGSMCLSGRILKLFLSIYISYCNIRIFKTRHPKAGITFVNPQSVSQPRAIYFDVSRNIIIIGYLS